jgi:flagellin
MQVNNNISSFNVWTNYTKNVTSLRKSMSKLSSGSRINNAGDDPSGLAMSERLRAQKRNTAASANNVENMLNYLQTTDSWAQKIHDMLGRMGELAVMANDGTKSTVDKDNLQKEFVQMQREISQITDSKAKFNGVDLFDGGDRTIQVGPDGGQTFSNTGADFTSDSTVALNATSAWDWTDVVTVTDVGTTASIGVNDATLAAANGGAGVTITETIEAVNEAIDHVSGYRADLGAEMKRLDHTLDGLRTYEENLAATESRIRDVDVAKETAEMSKYSILQQVGTAMLAQANQVPQGVLQLIR